MQNENHKIFIFISETPPLTKKSPSTLYFSYEMRNFAPMKTQFLISAPASGSGKTTMARGLIALFAQKGYRVQPYKCGPDYIDTQFHLLACGTPSVNLDTLMAPPQYVKDMYAHYAEQAQVCVVEGMMGLYDGYDRDKGSTAEIARTLSLPVVMVVNARSAAYSMAPLLYGFIHFRDDVNVAGVIFNQTGSERHQQMLRQVCQDLGIVCYGCLPKMDALQQPSRYLGLDFSVPGRLDSLVPLIEKHIDWQRLLHDMETADPVASRSLPAPPHRRVWVARNEESFSFLYQEQVNLLGDDITFFNPEEDIEIPPGIDLLYLPGGYPEKHLDALTAAEKTRRSVKRFAEQGGHVVAECGGMMYLCDKIVADDGEYPLCGVLPYTITARTADRKLSLGYRRFVLDGREYRGHEFHYTQFLGSVPSSATQVYDAVGRPVPTPVFRYKNVLASYTHLYQI